MELRIDAGKPFKLTLGASMALAEALEQKALSLDFKAMKLLTDREKSASEIAVEIMSQAEQLEAVASRIREVL